MPSAYLWIEGDSVSALSCFKNNITPVLGNCVLFVLIIVVECYPWSFISLIFLARAIWLLISLLISVLVSLLRMKFVVFFFIVERFIPIISFISYVIVCFSVSLFLGKAWCPALGYNVTFFFFNLIYFLCLWGSLKKKKRVRNITSLTLIKIYIKLL